MTAETLVFLATVLLAFVHIIVMAGFAQINYGMGELLGPRDNLKASDSVYLGRATRANENFKETLPWALGLLILVQVTGDASATTAAGAWLYFWSRVVYLPLYILGVPGLRTLVWTASLVGLAMLLFPVF